MKKDLAIWGWWEGENLGDQWIKNTMKKIFPNAEFVDTKFRKFNQYKFIICGGGGLFIDSVPSVWKRASAKVHYGMIGLGAEFPHRNNDVTKVAHNAEFFYVRDQYSLDCMHITDKPKSYDITFFEPLPVLDDTVMNLDTCFFVWRTPNEQMLKNKEFINYQKTNYDYNIWNNTIYSNFKKIINDDFITYEFNVFDKLNNCDIVISGRYHGIVAAIQRGIPCIAIDVCPKIRALMKEVGIEKYCLKYNEANKLDGLIKELKREWKVVRKLELSYRHIANKTLVKQMESAKFQILKILSPMKVIHYGSYFFGRNDVIRVMADELHNNNKAIIKEINTKRPINLLNVSAIIPTDNGIIAILSNLRLLKDIIIYHPDAIILNSGGFTLDKLGNAILKRFKIFLIGIELSDPDVFPYNGNIYSKRFDLYYTNARYSIQNQYNKIGVKVGLLGFAASPNHHYFMSDVEKKYDVVIVGGCRSDRIPIVNELKKFFNIGLYGSGWENSLGFVSGKEQVKAINTGKIYLSFSRTMAGYNNVKVGLFEAVACKSFVITEYMDELNEYFVIGEEVVCYRERSELIEIIRYYLEHEEERLLIAERGYQKFLNSHTYKQRWDIVLKDLYTLRGGIDNE